MPPTTGRHFLFNKFYGRSQDRGLKRERGMPHITQTLKCLNMKMKIMLLLSTVLFTLQAMAQSIAGKVTDDGQRAIAGATVQVYQAGKRISSTSTDLNGKYAISVSPGKYDLLTSHAGYIQKKVPTVTVIAKATTNINVKLVRTQTPVSQKPKVIKKNYTVTDQEVSMTEPSVAGAAVREYKSNAKDEAYRYSAPPPSSAVSTQYFNPSIEEYKKVAENNFMNVQANPLSTMSIDVDRASYANVRRYIQSGQMPPADAVRVEEMINYFKYNYPAPANDDPIAITTTLTDCPWKKEHKLLKIGMQAKNISYDRLPASNLVFLIDVSGSMYSQDKLPLLISSMKLLVKNLRNEDRVSIVTYAGNAGVVLPSTPGSKKEKIIAALEKLQAGGSTAGAEGILTAYKVAQEHFIRGGNNRIILSTDGDFNVGVSSDNELEELITREREKGIFLSCLGFGTGNFKDAKMEMLADKGNGNYSYIDNIEEGRKTLVNEFGGTLFTIAKDVKAQIEFNPHKVQSYRLVGYENRMLSAEDFKDDKKDAGELGAGHTVTFIYEIVPTGIRDKNVRPVNDLKYNALDDLMARDEFDNELATVKFRYKKPEGTRSTEMTHTIKSWTTSVERVDEDTRFAYSVALFGMILKNSKFKGDGTINDVLEMAKNSKGADEDGYRAEFVKLVKSIKDDIAVSKN
jgi:Ca-activated chloride channel family protein